MKKELDINDKIYIELNDINNKPYFKSIEQNDLLNHLTNLYGTNEIISLDEYIYSYELICIGNKTKLDKLFKKFNDNCKYLIVCFDSNNLQSYIHLNSNNKREIIKEFKILQKQLNKIEKGIY